MLFNIILTPLLIWIFIILFTRFLGFYLVHVLHFFRSVWLLLIHALANILIYFVVHFEAFRILVIFILLHLSIIPLTIIIPSRCLTPFKIIIILHLSRLLKNYSGLQDVGAAAWDVIGSLITWPIFQILWRGSLNDEVRQFLHQNRRRRP